MSKLVYKVLKWNFITQLNELATCDIVFAEDSLFWRAIYA